MALTNTELAAKLDLVVTGWQGFTDELIDWLMGTGTVALTDPYTSDVVNVKTPTQLQADYDTLLGPTNSQLSQVQDALDDANLLLTNAQALDTIYQGYVTDAQAAETASQNAQTAAELARDNAQTAETNAETAEANASASESAALTAQTAAETAETDAQTAQAAAEAAQLAAETAETNAVAAVAPFTPLGNDVNLASGMMGIKRVPANAELEINGELRLITTDETEYFSVLHGATRTNVRRIAGTGNAAINIEALPEDNLGDAEVAFNRFTDTTGEVASKWYKGDGSGDIDFQIGVNGAPSYSMGTWAVKDPTDTDGVTKTGLTDGYKEVTATGWTRVVNVPANTTITVSEVPKRGFIQIVGGDADAFHFAEGVYEKDANGAIILNYNSGNVSTPVTNPSTFGSNQVMVDVDGNELRIKNDVVFPLTARVFGKG